MAELDTNFSFKVKSKTGKTVELLVGSVLTISPVDYDLVSAEIQFLVDAIEVSKFILQEDGNVFMEERPDPILDVSATSTEETVKDLIKWTDAINKFPGLPLQPQSKFVVETEQDISNADTVKGKFTLLGVLLFDATWDKSDEEIDFGLRVEDTVTWANFNRYVTVVKNFVFEEIPEARKA